MQFVKNTLNFTRLFLYTPSNVKLSNMYFSKTTIRESPTCLLSNFDNSAKMHIQPIALPFRNMFIYRSGDFLWEGVTGPPGRGKKRARGKRRVVRNKVNLDMGRKIGENKMNYKWPGLNAPVYDKTTIMRRTTGDKDENYDKKLLDLRNKQSKKKYRRFVPPLTRGWTGGTIGGQSLGKPEPVIGQNWEGFDSRVLEMKMVSTMTASKGRFGRFSAVVMVGNGKGLAGVGKAKSTNLPNALKIAKRKATQKFEYYNLKEMRTLWHPDFIKEWSTGIYVKPMSEGYGLVCHRLIKTMCQLIGIKDLYAKVEGSVKNYQVIVRVFTALLRKQETFQDMANRLSLNVVEFRNECDNYPKLLAAPSTGVTRVPDPEENLDFDRLHLGGKVFWSKKYKPFYLNLPGPKKHREIRRRFRNLNNVERSEKVLNYLAQEGQLLKKVLINEKKE